MWLFLLAIVWSSHAIATPPCGHDGFSFRSECFVVRNMKYVWHEAALECHGRDTVLVTITDNEMNEFIARKIQEDVWIGLLDTPQEGDWRWSDDTPVNYTNFQDDALSRVPPERANCVMLQRGTGLWQDTYCHDRKAFLCASPRGEPLCGNGGTFFRNRCYWLERSYGWHQANDVCQNQYGNGVKLPVVVDAELNAFLSRHVYPSVWLGLKYHLNQGKWLWINGHRLDNVSYTNWREDQVVDNIVDGGMCAQLNYDEGNGGTWTRHVCTEYAWFVCAMQPCYSYDGPPLIIGSGAGDGDGDGDGDDKEQCLDFENSPTCTCVSGARCKPTGECQCQKLYSEMKCDRDDLKVRIHAPNRITPGQSITMRCQVNLPPSDVTVTWHKVTGSELLPEERSSIDERPDDGQYILTISDTRTDDTGSYLCIATTILGEIGEPRLDSIYLHVGFRNVTKPTADQVAHDNEKQISPKEKAFIGAVAVLGVCTVVLLVTVFITLKRLSSLRSRSIA